MNNAFFMWRCLELAKLGKGFVAPNPMVGAVLVHDGKIIGEAYHQAFGGPHAEVNCIRSVPADLEHLIADSTLFVSLEPCAHFGKTPPCAHLIVEKKIPHVVIGCRDINEEVSGKGIAILKDAGIKVEMSDLEDECIYLNRRFFTFLNQHRPYIMLKWAQTMNGMIGSETERMAISNAYTNLLVHQWRSEEAAILVGRKTAVMDNPLLTNRSGKGLQPVRIILCNEQLPTGLSMFNQSGKTIVMNTVEDRDEGIVLFKKVEKANYLKDVLRYLFDNQIQSVLIEGGRNILQQFLDAGLWDECRVVTNTGKIVKGGVPAPDMPELKCTHEMRIQNDLIQYFANFKNLFVKDILTMPLS